MAVTPVRIQFQEVAWHALAEVAFDCDQHGLDEVKEEDTRRYLDRPLSWLISGCRCLVGPGEQG